MAAAKQALEEGSALEASGDLRAALDKYDRAGRLDASLAPTAGELSTKVKARMQSEVADALTRAKQYDALDRVADAIKWYERAYANQLDDDPNKKTVKARLDLLRAQK